MEVVPPLTISTPYLDLAQTARGVGISDEKIARSLHEHAKALHNGLS